MDDLGAGCCSGFDGEHADCWREVEAAWAAGAGIEVQHTFSPIDAGPVGVAVEDGGEFRRDGIETKRAEIVEQIEVVAFEEQNVGFGQAAAGAVAINVPTYCVKGSDLFESLENRGVADVTQMQDVIDASQGGNHFRTQKTVGVTHDADLHLLKLRTCDQIPLWGFSVRALRARNGSSIWRRFPESLGSSIAMQ